MKLRFLLALLLLPACSLSGIDRANLPTCVTDTDCAALAITVEDPDCDTFVCVRETGRCEPARVDADRDGDSPRACGGTDCDDRDAARFGGATEICNGIDDDCDEALDGPDEDDDGDRATDLCAGPTMARDCDDTDPSTSFGAMELCDGFDNDCLLDGVARQGGGRRAEPNEDADGDLHAAIDALCVAGPDEPRFFPLDDCDDTRDDVYPGADERCDGVDNDCDGILDDAGTAVAGRACLPSRLLAGGSNTCVLDGDDQLVCWGINHLGQLGDAAALPDAAIVVDAARGLTSLSMDGIGACGVGGDGSVTCWGSTYLFERVRVSMNTPHPPAVVPGVTGAIEVSVGSSHACALNDTGTVTCWGYSCPGTYVDGVNRDCGFSLLPVAVAGIDDAVEVDAGGLMTCARRASGEVWCWGFNPVGRLGTGDLSPSYDGPPAAVVGIDDAVRLAVGGSFACAQRASGELWCWGENVGCVGAGCAPMIATAARVPLDGEIADFTVGGRHACVRYTDGRFGCWGDNTFGQLAVVDLGIAALLAPQTSATEDVLEVVAGANHTCARLDDRILCWGGNSAGELGDGRTGTAAGPFAGFLGVPVSVTANAMQIVGGSSSTCFRLPDLSVVCTGANPFGELDGPHPDGVPSAAFGVAPAIDVGLAIGRSMVVHADHRVSTYGDSRFASEGVEDAEGFLVGVNDAVDASCSDRTSCFVRENGTVACIGVATNGMLGDGGVASETCAYGTCTRTPLPVVGLQRVVSIASGSQHNCVIRDDGSVACWGLNDAGQTGSLPLGITPRATTVMGLPEGDPAVGLALTNSGSCAVLASGAVWCWGQGFGTLSSSFSVDPGPLVGAANIAQIAGFGAGLCVRQRSGVVRCVGENASGTLGDGTNTSSDVLRTVTGVTDARDLGCGESHCCATRRGGQTVCWGENSSSQLGNGFTDDRNRATAVASMLWSL